MQERFGRIIAEYNEEPGAKTKRMARFGLFALVFFALAVVLKINFPGAGELFMVIDDGTALLLIIVFTLIGIFFAFFTVKFSKSVKAVIYEKGISYTYGQAVTELAFEDTEGVKVVSLALGGVQTNAGNMAQVTLQKKDGSQLKMMQNAVPQYRQFVDKFGTVYTKWLLKDLTMDNIAQKEMSFGPDFKLRGGGFVYLEGKKPEVPIPLTAIKNIEVEEDDKTALFLNGSGGERLASIWIPTALNLEALMQILQMISKHERE
jgi:polyferredoxin